MKGSAVLLADTSNGGNAALGLAIIGVFLVAIAVLVVLLVKSSNRAARAEGERNSLFAENQQLRHALGIPPASPYPPGAPYAYPSAAPYPAVPGGAWPAPRPDQQWTPPSPGGSPTGWTRADR